MTNRLSISNKKNNSELPFSNATRGRTFESRPFVVQSKSDNSKPAGLKTSLIQAEKYGHHLGKTYLANQSVGTVVQPKLDNQPIQQAGRKRKAGSSLNNSGQVSKKHKGKQRELEKLGYEEPNKTPMEILKQNRDLLVRKRNPHKSGDHSPSLATYNKTTDGQIRATGRPHAKNQQGSVALDIGENQIPTHHFASQGEESHSVLTSLRAAAGVGEHASHSFDDLLDKTGSAYRGTPKLADGTPIRSHVRLPGKDNDSQNNFTSHPVAPLIAQQIININMRRSVKDGKPSKRII